MYCRLLKYAESAVNKKSIVVWGDVGKENKNEETIMFALKQAFEVGRAQCTASYMYM